MSPFVSLLITPHRRIPVLRVPTASPNVATSPTIGRMMDASGVPGTAVPPTGIQIDRYQRCGSYGTTVAGPPTHASGGSAAAGSRQCSASATIFLAASCVDAFVARAAASGGAAQGGAVMLAFGLGTVPMLTALTFFSARVASSLRERLFRLAGVIVVMGGALLVLRGLADLRLLPHGPAW